MTRIAFTCIGLAGVLAACDGFKEAMTAHVDVVARAGSQELSVTRLADLLGSSQVPLDPQRGKDIARAVANVWVDYQLLGRAAARNDSLKEVKAIDDALWAEISQMRSQKWYERVSQTWGTPDSATEAKYNQGELLAARHILFPVPPQGLTQASQDSIRTRAERVRAQVTAANFGNLARQHGSDGTKERGGSLGVFPPGQMVPEFERAVTALQPGQIAPGLVRTQFGWHIIQRMSYADARTDFEQAYTASFSDRKQTQYLEDLEKAGNIVVKDNAATIAKAVAANLEGNRENKTVIATSKAGDFTAARLARWIRAFPPQAQIAQQIQQQPDSMIPTFIKAIVRNELVLLQADSAKITLDSTELATLRGRFTNAVVAAWGNLGVDPSTLNDSGSTPADRERIAAARIDRYVDELLAERAQFIPVQEPLQTVLRDKYESKINDAGLERAVERAMRVRATLDSTRAMQQPQSQVPMPPGMRPTPTTPQTQPQAQPRTQPQQAPRP